MQKSLEMGQISAAGGFHIFFGRILSTIIMAVGTIVLGGLILQSDYGLYTIALIPATTLMLFQDWGVSTALTRYCARCRETNNFSDLRKIITRTILFQVAIGVILAALLILLSPLIAQALFNKPESAFLIALSSSVILFSAVSASPSSVFVGFERMKPSIIVLLVGALLQSVTAPVLVALGYGALGAVVGYVVGIVASSAISIGLLYYLVLRRLPASSSHAPFLPTLKSFLSFGVPYAAATLVGGLGVQFVGFMMATYCDTSTIGVYKVATNFMVVSGFFTIPITTMLYPAFSKVDPIKERSLLNSVFTSSTKYASLLLVPATLGMIALADPLISTLYGVKWAQAPLFLSILVLSDLLVIFGSLSLPNLLLALGKTKFLFKTKIVYLVVSVVLGSILIPTFGMAGVLFVSCISGAPTVFICYYYVCKKNNFSAGVRTTVKILGASLVSFAGTLLFVFYSPLASLLNLFVGCLLFVGMLLFALPSFGAINQTDIETLRIMFRSTGFISKFIDVPLLIMQRIMHYFPDFPLKIADPKKAQKPTS
jgi:O-antigen/teichoic acid export membrane protein